MFLIDLFLQEDKLYAWLYDGSNHFYECTFYPSLYACGENLFRIPALLGTMQYSASLERRNTLYGLQDVLHIRVPLRHWKAVRRLLKEYELFNSDISLDEYYLFENDLFPGAIVTAVLDEHDCIISISALDGPFDAYEFPDLCVVHISLVTDKSVRSDAVSLLSVLYNDEEYTIDGFVERFLNDDPDIVVLQNTHLIFLLREIRKLYPGFSFSRFGKDIFASSGNVYTSYGQVHYKDPATYLRGRLHLSPGGVLYGTWSLEYAVEMGRLCHVPLQKINHRSTGYGVASAQQYTALNMGFLIPYKRTCVEEWRSGLDLFNADRGPLTYEPRVGFHTGVAEIDFVSLYPNIMVKYNISPETFGCRCCLWNTVPGLEMHFCTKKDGIMRTLLRPMIAQRQKYKELGFTERANALKGFLVCCFGYMGFRKSKLARIECHQAILAYAREILLAASKIAEEEGFVVVHGIVDSLWVKGGAVEMLMKRIDEELGLPIKLEGYYRWIVFLPSTLNKDVPVPTRYYGVFDEGEMKVRGIELRRHDTPPIIKRMQEEMILLVASARTEREFLEKLPSCKRVLGDTIARLRTGVVVAEELAITIRLSKTDYTCNIAQKQIVKELVRKGLSPQAGQYIKYVIQDRKKYSTSPLPYSQERYAALAQRAFQSLFSQFHSPITLNDYTRTTITEVSIQIPSRIGRTIGETVFSEERVPRI